MVRRSVSLLGLVAAPAILACASSDPVVVGEVPNQPAAANAVRSWAADFGTGDMATLVANCWTIAPDRVRSMYSDYEAIEHAIAQPGIDGQFAFIWQDDLTRISVKRSEVASGYACPYVSAQNDVHIYNAADAQYRVERFLQRVIGNPVDPQDTEANYPLECTGWEPTALSDSSRSIASTMTAYDRSSLETVGGPDDWETYLQGTSSDGGERVYRYTTAIGPEGYCVSKVQ